jgi:hypothetical protein
MSICPAKPLYQEDFEWATLEELREAQMSCGEDCPEDLTQDPKLRVKFYSSGLIWVPDKNHLRERICVIAHSGPAGHRGILTTQRAIASQFFWPSMSDAVPNSSKACLHRIGSKDLKVPKPLGEAIHASEKMRYYIMTSCSSGIRKILQRLSTFWRSRMIYFITLNSVQQAQRITSPLPIACWSATSDSMEQNPCN